MYRETKGERRIRQIGEGILKARPYLQAARVSYVQRERKARENSRAWNLGLTRFRAVEDYRDKEEIHEQWGDGYIGKIKMERLMALMDQKEAYLEERRRVDDHVTRMLDDAMQGLGKQYGQELGDIFERQYLYEMEARERGHGEQTPASRQEPAYVRMAEGAAFGAPTRQYRGNETYDDSRHRENLREAADIRRSIKTARRYIRDARLSYLAELLGTSRKKAADLSVFDELEGFSSKDDILEAWGFGDITLRRSDRLARLLELREENVDASGRFVDTITELLEHAEETCGAQYTSFLAAVDAAAARIGTGNAVRSGHAREGVEEPEVWSGLRL